MLVASPRLHKFNEAVRNFTNTAHQTYEVIKVIGANYSWIVPSGIVVRVRFAPVKSASVRFALSRVASVKFAPVKSASVRFAFNRFALVQSASHSVAPVRFAPVRFAPVMLKSS